MSTRRRIQRFQASFRLPVDQPIAQALRSARQAIEQRMRQAQDAASSNIVGVGIGHKTIDGHNTRIPCITVQVRKKLHGEISRELRLPAWIQGFPVDVVETGDYRSAWLPWGGRRRHCGQLWPTVGGTCVGSSAHLGHCGTAAGVVSKTGSFFVLTNRHVVHTAGLPDPEKPQEIELYQPGRGKYINDAPALIARGADLAPLNYYNTTTDPFNTLDAAIVKITRPTISGEVCRVGRPSPIPAVPKSKIRVVKAGFGSGRQYGEISLINLSRVIKYETTNALYMPIFEDLFEIIPEGRIFATDGDSGSWVLSEDGLRPVGLILAANPETGSALAIPAQTVLKHFGVSVVP